MSKDYSEEVKNFRNNLIHKRREMKLKDWLSYCSKLVVKLEQRGTLENNQLKGELSEVVLEMMLEDIQELFVKSGTRCLIMKNVGMLNRGENGKLYSTEIDVCFATEYRVYLFEVKSYSGNKVLTKECYLEGKSKADIYSQSKLHADIFTKLFDDCRLKYIMGRKGMCAPLNLVFFEFSSSKVKDLRTREWKKNIPYINVDNIYEWMLSEISNPNVITKKQWNLDKMLARMKKLDKERELIMDYHIDRLKRR